MYRTFKIDKEKPVKPIFETDRYELRMMDALGIDARCGKCRGALRVTDNYCKECGHKIDWRG